MDFENTNSVEEAIAAFKNKKPALVFENSSDTVNCLLVFPSQTSDITSIENMQKITENSLQSPVYMTLLESIIKDIQLPSINMSMNTNFIENVLANRNIIGPFSVKAFTENENKNHSPYIEIITSIKKIISGTFNPQELQLKGNLKIIPSKNGGVLQNAELIEAANDLVSFGGFLPSVLAFIPMNGSKTSNLNSDEKRNSEQIKALAHKFNIPMVSIESVISYRLQLGTYVVKISEAVLPTDYGIFKIAGFQNTLDGKEHIALVKGNIETDKPVMVRVHSECLTGDAFGSKKCECGSQLHTALSMIENEGIGALIYLRQEGRGIGLLNKIKAYHLQDNGMDTVDANLTLGFPPDLRDYGIGAQIIYLLGIKKIRLLTNNPKKVIGLSGYGLDIVERIPLVTGINKYNIQYMQTKKKRMDHIIE